MHAKPIQRAAALALILLTGVVATTVMAIEEPSYRVVQSFPAFELRQYAPYLVAETTVDAGFDQAGNRAFRILADYIFGNNRAKEKIQMTAPVTQQPATGGQSPKGEQIEMTAPVTQRPAAVDTGTGADRYVLSFVMPRRFTLDTLPAPNDPRVKLGEEPARLMAVRQYSGSWTEASYRREEDKLMDAVRKQGYEAIGTPVYARFLWGFSLWFMRRNEVMVEVRKRD